MWKKLEFNSVSPALRGEGASPHEEWQRFVEGFDFFGLIEAWREIVGDMMAEQSLPLRLKNRTLFILTKHPAFAERLKFMEKLLLQKIGERFPEASHMLEHLAFESNESFFKEKAKTFIKPPPPKLHPQSPLYKKLRQEAEVLFATVENIEEREQWISLYLQMAQTNNPHST
ncbi:MAG: DUF721 domain-containing protein [Bacteriovoracaceae bacterium]|nr:DUF721 domain-containing protein [Bacteriovoracaceae bacterium]